MCQLPLPPVRAPPRPCRTFPARSSDPRPVSLPGAERPSGRGSECPRPALRRRRRGRPMSPRCPVPLPAPGSFKGGAAGAGPAAAAPWGGRSASCAAAWRWRCRRCPRLRGAPRSARAGSRAPAAAPQVPHRPGPARAPAAAPRSSCLPEPRVAVPYLRSLLETSLFQTRGRTRLLKRFFSFSI